MFLGLPMLSFSKILENLESLNTDLQALGKTANIVIVGGSAVSLLSGGLRQTSDIDYLGELPLSEMELRKYQLSNDVERVFVVPDISEVSFDKELTYSNLTVYVLSWEDLAIMKFYTTRKKRPPRFETFYSTSNLRFQ